MLGSKNRVHQKTIPKPIGMFGKMVAVKDGLKRPNNWRSMVGDRAWQYHPARHQFYYHGFLPFQPDLNYNSEEVKKAMFDIVRFWLDKGVDGFRLDIISAIHEDSTLKNNPPSAKLLPSDSKLTIFFQYRKKQFFARTKLSICHRVASSD
jgi:glycosidase